MTSRAVDPRRDPSRPRPAPEVTITFEGRDLHGISGQTVAGVLLANGITSWRTTSVGSRPRGAFCGIGVCFDCLVTVDDRRDVRACLSRPSGGETITRQHDLPPAQPSDEPGGA